MYAAIRKASFRPTATGDVQLLCFSTVDIGGSVDAFVLECNIFNPVKNKKE